MTERDGFVVSCREIRTGLAAGHTRFLLAKSVYKSQNLHLAANSLMVERAPPGDMLGAWIFPSS
jgi:hypothetical protein